MRRRLIRGAIIVGFAAGGLLLLSSASASASSVRERIMAKRAANGWDCSSGTCHLPRGGRTTAARTQRATATEQVSAPLRMGGPKQIEISLAQQRLTAYEGQRVVLSTPISAGTASHPTPTGSFSILSKEQMHWSSQYRAWMPYAMRIFGGVFIHETPLDAKGNPIGASQIGSPASHGCIRVPSGAARRLYAWADIGTPVVVH